MMNLDCSKDSIIMGRYQILRHLGEGAQSKVFLVKDLEHLGALKALKVVADSVKTSTRDDLIKEFNTLQTLEHPYLVRVLDFKFCGPEAVPIVVTEYIPDALSLEDLLSERRFDSDTTFSLRAHIACQLLQAIHYLRQKKVIHGDLKPRNILLVHNPEIADNECPYIVKVIDFGVAQDLIVDRNKKRAGTPYYIAPEVVTQGLHFNSDLYSLGVIFYRMFVSNTLPYQGKSFESICEVHQNPNRQMFSPVDIQKNSTPPLIQQLLERLLEKDPFARIIRPEKEVTRLLQAFLPDQNTLAIEIQDVLVRDTQGQGSISEKVFEFLSKDSQLENRVFFASGPPGSGKTRFLADVERKLRAQKTATFSFPFQSRHFWNGVVRYLARSYPNLPASQHFLQHGSLERYNLESQAYLARKVIEQLAHHLKGLVLLVDGVTDDFDESFFVVLHMLVSGEKQSVKAPYRLILTLQTKAPSIVSGNEDEEISSTDFLPYLTDPKTLLTTTESSHDRLRSLKHAHWAVLKPLELKEVESFLRHISISNHSMTKEEVEWFFSRSKGNPGLLMNDIKDFSTMLLRNDQAEKTRFFSHSSTSQRTLDLHILRYNRYSKKDRLVIALIGILQPLSIHRLRVLMQALRGGEEAERLNEVIGLALDDGLLRMNPYDQALDLATENLRQTMLRELAGRYSEINQSLRALFRRGEMVLLLNEKVALAEALQAPEEFFASLAALDPTELGGGGLKKVKPYLEIYFGLLRHGKIDFSRTNSLRHHGRILFLVLEMYIILQQTEQAQILLLEIEHFLKSRSQEFSRPLWPDYCFKAGLIYRSIGKMEVALEFFDRALEGSLDDQSRCLFIEANQHLCRLYLLGKHSQQTEEFRKQKSHFHRARRALKYCDPMSYALATAGFAAFLIDSRRTDEGVDVRPAFTYLRIATKIFRGHGQTGREFGCEFLIAKTHFNHGDIKPAINAFERALMVADRHDFPGEKAKVLTFLIQCDYKMEDFLSLRRRVFHLQQLVRTTKEFSRNFSIVEPVIHLLIQTGELDKATDLIAEQMADCKVRRESGQGYPINQMVVVHFLGAKTALAKNDLAVFNHHLDEGKKALEEMPKEHPYRQDAFFAFAWIEIEGGLLSHFDETLPKAHSVLQSKTLPTKFFTEGFLTILHFLVINNRPSEAVAMLAEAEKIAGEVGMIQRFVFFTDALELALLQSNEIQAVRWQKQAARLLPHIINIRHKERLARLQAQLQGHSRKLDANAPFELNGFAMAEGDLVSPHISQVDRIGQTRDKKA